jgi:hypothetical protein
MAMRELRAWVPTCGWGIPQSSAEPAATILTTPQHHPSACPVCGRDDCLEDAGTVKAAKLLNGDFDYDIATDVFDRAERLANRDARRADTVAGGDDSDA